MATLTLSQRQAVKTDFTVTHAATVFGGRTLAASVLLADWPLLSQYYNQLASPTVTLWKPDVQFGDLLKQIVASEAATWTTNQLLLLNVLSNLPIVDATSLLVRNLFNNIASGTTISNWSSTSRRSATNLEALFTTAASGFFTSAVVNQVMNPDDVYACNIS